MHTTVINRQVKDRLTPLPSFSHVKIPSKFRWNEDWISGKSKIEDPENAIYDDLETSKSQRS